MPLNPFTIWRRLPTDPTQAASMVSQAVSKPVRAIGGALGGAAGYFSGDEDTPQGERLLRAAGGGVLGGAALPGMARSAMMAGNVPNAVVNGMYYNYLSSPDTIARANFGAMGGVMARGIEEMLSGNLQSAGRMFGALAEGADVWRRSLVGSPEEVRALRQEIIGSGAGGRLDIPSEAFRDVGLGKWFTAGDNAAVYVMKKSGMTPEEAMRYTLAGTPETQMGKSFVGLQSKWLREGSIPQRLTAAAVAPFARVGVLGLEQGLRHLPGVAMTKAAGGPGFKSLFEKGAGRTGSPVRQAIARQVVGGGAMAAGSAMEEQFDPRLSLVTSTLAGPAFLPYALGREFKRQRQRTPNLMAAIGGAAGEGLMEFSPMGQGGLGAWRSPWTELPRRAIPAAFSDVAEALDPAFGRKQGQRELERLAELGEIPQYMAEPSVAPAMARIPGLRGKLPEEFPPVDIFGKPRFERPEVVPGAENIPMLRGMSRMLFPSRMTAVPPAQNLLDPQMRQLYDLGVRPAPPGQRVEMPGLGGKIQMPAETVAGVQRWRGQARERTAQILQQLAPWLMSLPPQQRAIMTQYLNAYLSQAQGPAVSGGALGMALQGGGQLPRF